MASLRGKSLHEVALIVETHTKEGLRTLNQHFNLPPKMTCKPSAGKGTHPEAKFVGFGSDMSVSHSDSTLLSEIKYVLKSNGLRPEQVHWVGSANGKVVMSWGHFERLAAKRYFVYNKLKYVTHIPSDLVIVGADFFIDREYIRSGDSKWVWRVHKMPKIKSLYASPEAEINVMDMGCEYISQTLSGCNKRNRAEMRKYAKPDEFLGAGDPNLRKVNTGRKRSIGGKQIV